MGLPLLRDRMNNMDDLPKSSVSATPQVPPVGSVSPVGSMAKESAPLAGFPETPAIVEIGREVELPPEVKKAGVMLKSDTITVPPPVAKLGVQAVGPAAQGVVPAVISLPLTDDQIAQGLHQSLLSSVRWLAEWCVRQLHMVHMTVKSVHGNIVRTKE